MDEAVPSEDEVKPDFVINSLKILAAQYKRDADQVPLALNIPGVPSLRKEQPVEGNEASPTVEAYKVTEE